MDRLFLPSEQKLESLANENRGIFEIVYETLKPSTLPIKGDDSNITRRTNILRDFDFLKNPLSNEYFYVARLEDNIIYNDGNHILKRNRLTLGCCDTKNLYFVNLVFENDSLKMPSFDPQNDSLELTKKTNLNQDFGNHIDFLSNSFFKVYPNVQSYIAEFYKEKLPIYSMFMDFKANNFPFAYMKGTKLVYDPLINPELENFYNLDLFSYSKLSIKKNKDHYLITFDNVKPYYNFENLKAGNLEIKLNTISIANTSLN
jgi:hypothetical protein